MTPCNKKLCLYGTDASALKEMLYELAEHPSAWAVKISTYQKGGIFLGRAFFMDGDVVGETWAKLKSHDTNFCSVQDDDWTAPYRA